MKVISTSQSNSGLWFRSAQGLAMHIIKCFFWVCFWLFVYFPVRAVHEATGYIVDKVDGWN